MSDAASTFLTGARFSDYLSSVRVHRQAFQTQYEKLAGIVGELRQDPPLRNVQTLAIVEDWCPDCVFNVPILARFAEASDPDSFRIVRRPDVRPLADRFPGRGGASRIPTFVFMNESGHVLGYWSERCASSQAWFNGFTLEHPLPELTFLGGIPAPALLAWMNLRIAEESERFFAGVWRDVLAEIRAIVRGAAQGS